MFGDIDLPLNGYSTLVVNCGSLLFVMCSWSFNVHSRTDCRQNEWWRRSAQCRTTDEETGYDDSYTLVISSYVKSNIFSALIY